MKKYTLDFKYIRNKYVAALAVLNCIYDAVVPEDEELDWDESPTKCRISKTKAMIALSNNMMHIMSYDMNTNDYFCKYDALETVLDAKCFRKLPQSIADVEYFIDEPVVIEFKGMFCDPEIMQFVPDFSPEKVKIELPEPMFPEVDRIIAAENM